MLGWVKHGATIEIAASICGISESRLNDWYRLAQHKPESPLGVLMRDLEQLAKVAGNWSQLNRQHCWRRSWSGRRADLVGPPGRLADRISPSSAVALPVALFLSVAHPLA